MPRADVDYLLNAVHVRGERGNYDPLVRMVSENVSERFADLFFGHREAGAFGVCRLAEKQGNSLVSELAETGYIHHFSLDRRGVELEIARVYDRSERSVYRQAAGVCDRVVDSDKFNVEGTETDCLARANTLEDRLIGRRQLAELVFDDSESKLCSVYGWVDRAKHVGNCADMILVPVGKDNTAQLLFVCFNV